MNNRYNHSSLWTVSFWAVFVVFIWSTEAVRIKLPPNVTVPAVLVFGDSIVDTGNNNANVLSPARSNFRPYGKDFPGGIPTGRYSNGKVPSDLIVEALGIKDLLPPYSNSNLTSEELITGVCFAVGGVGYDPLTSKLASVPVLTDQLNKLEEYIEKLKGIVGEEKTKFIIANSVVFVVFSSNDIANTYFTSGTRNLQYDIPSYCDLMISGASEFLKALYAMGLKRLAAVSTPPIGCVPSQRTLGGGLQRDCYEKENEAAKLFNLKLAGECYHLNELFSDANIIYVDIYNPLLNIIQNPTKYGFKIANKGCCGSGLMEAALTCNPFDTTCDDDTIYVFWDAFHPTERAYRVFIDQVLSYYIDKLVQT